MSEQDFTNLTGKMLIATPLAMEGNIFHQSLIYVIKHTKEGSIGLIFNRPMKDPSSDDLFKTMSTDIKFDLSDLKFNMHLGGPVELDRGFLLHTTDYDKNIIFKSEDNSLAISSNAHALKDIANNSGPEKSLLIMGCTLWQEGEMEFEIESNLWIVAEPDKDLIFSKGDESQWNKALNKLGISLDDYILQESAVC